MVLPVPVKVRTEDGQERPVLQTPRLPAPGENKEEAHHAHVPAHARLGNAQGRGQRPPRSGVTRPLQPRHHAGLHPRRSRRSSKSPRSHRSERTPPQTRRPGVRASPLPRQAQQGPALQSPLESLKRSPKQDERV